MNTKQLDIKKQVAMKNKFRVILIFFLPLMASQESCKKFVDIPPPDGIIAENSVYNGDATATAVLTGLYTYMNFDPIQGIGSMSMFAGLSADEYTLITGANASHLAYYRNGLSQITGTNVSGGELYGPFYNYIFKCNAAIEGLNLSNSLTPLVKRQLIGEAKFMRAFFYFYLANMFGNVPLALTTDPQINTLLARSAKSKVYDQIIADLLDAEEKLSENYLDATLLGISNERTRPTKWAATALLARVYLYKGDYSNAEVKATTIISNNSKFILLSLNSVFLKNSKEAIWQIQPFSANFNTSEAQMLVVPASGPNNFANPIYLSKNLLNSFETGDQRAVFGNWIDTTIYKISSIPLVWDTVAYPFKYKLNTIDPTITTTTGTANMKEYFMVMRLSEQYLIRAEARAKLNNTGGAQSDLNAIRNRAGLPNTTAGDQPSLLIAILNERRHELFSEWGNRWLDLKRTNNIDGVMTIVTPQKSNGTTSWQSFQQLYPIPLTELQLAPNMVQNAGY
jgi:hypothetical protein